MPNMWNRVVLLVSGMAFGWSLVHYASDAPDRQRTHLGRMIAALVVGVALVLWLGMTSISAALVAALVFVFIALVAYAANAKQVSKLPEPERRERPLAPLEGTHGVALLLVLPGEPRTYAGPAHWARRLRERAAVGQRISHWFVRPWAYGRIRQSYLAMGGQNSQRTALDELLRQLKPRLPQLECLGDAYQDTTPVLVEELVRLAQQGLRRIVLVPVGFQNDAADTLRDEVTRARVREIGVEVAIAAPLEAGVWPLEGSDQALDRLLRGEPLLVPAPPSEEQITSLASALEGRLLAG